MRRWLFHGKNLIWILAVLFGIDLFATTFIPVPLEEQVHNSYGVVYGRFVGTSYKKIRTGEIVTEATFQIEKIVGIPFNEIVNKNNFKVLYPGGIWQGVKYSVQGTPTFKEGEEVVLFVNKGPYGFQLSNLGFSKYSVIKERSKLFLKNSIFPNHPKLGKIELSHLDGILEKNFGHPLRVLNQDKDIYRENHEWIAGNRVRRRAPASSEEEISSEGEKDGAKIGIFWLVLIFSIMGGYSAFVMKSKK